MQDAVTDTSEELTKSCDLEVASPRRLLELRLRALACLLLPMVAWTIYCRLNPHPTDALGQVMSGRYLIDLNRATEAELNLLPGVGEKLARDILEYRDEHDGFRDVNELLRIRGIKEGRYQALAPHVTVLPQAKQNISKR